MKFGEAVTVGFRKYLEFSGRASRTEFWYWVLFCALTVAVASLLDAAVFTTTYFLPVNSVAALVLFLPSLAVMSRRLHDTGHAGSRVLIVFTVIGIGVLIYWACLLGTAGPNRYGEDPLADADRSRW